MARSIKRDFQYLSILTVIVSMLLLSGFWIFYDYRILQVESERLRSQHISEYENLLQDEVNRIVAYIDYKKSLARERLQKSIKERTNEACAIAVNIIKQNGETLDKATLQKLVKDSLRNIRYHNGRGYYFAVNMDGTEELFPTNPELEGQDLRGVQDSQGQFVVRDMLQIARSSGEGFYSYTWSMPGKPNTRYPKIAFVKHVPELDWILGTGEYLNDVAHDIQQEVLDWIEQIRFGKENKDYFFVGTWEGISKSFPAKGKNMLETKDINGVYVVRELIEQAKAGGGFVHYVMPGLDGIRSAAKLSYAAPIPDWEWYVGAGVYIDEIDILIANNRQVFKDKVLKHLKVVLVVLFCLFLINTIIAYVISRKVWNQIDLFSRFFQRASTESVSMQSEQLAFREFREIGKLANVMLEERNSFLRDISLSRDEWVNTFNAIGDLILLVDANGYVVQANEAAARILSLTQDELINTHFSRFCCNENPIHVTLQDKLPHSAEVENETLGKVFLASTFPICTAQGELHRVIHIAHDLTDQKKLKEQLAQSQKMEAVGLLAGGVAHDLNNILSGVVSYPDIILPQLPEGSRLKKQILAIQQSGQQAAEIVADLLTLARGIAANKKVEDLNALIIGYLVSPEGEKLKEQYPLISISTDLEPALLRCSCSAVHIKKSLMNLVINAAEAITDTGRVMITTHNQYIEPWRAKELHLASGDYVALKVTDTGSGIPAEDVERIFEPFYTKKVMGKSGSGLGLAVVWNTIQDHQGAIDVTSSSSGTVITLHLPATEEKVLENDKAILLEEIKGHGETILIVDDDPQQRDIALHMTRSLAYRSEAVATGEAAIAYLLDNRADLLLLDMILGTGLNGREVYEKIILRHPSQKALIVSGYSRDSEVREAQDLGAGGYLRKPYTLNQLGVAIRDVLLKDALNRP